MTSDHVIVRTGAVFLEFLRKVLAEELNMSGDQVGLCMPGEQTDFQVCAYLYDIQKNKDVHKTGMISENATQMRYPSTYYDLHYIVVPCLESDVKYRQEEEGKILDVLLQYLGDLFLLDIGQEIPFELNNVDFDVKTKLWAGLGKPLRTAVYCKAGPVEIRSGRKKKVSRVTELEMNFMQEGER